MKRLGAGSSPYLLLAPYATHFLVITAFPVVFSLVLTLHRWNLLSPMQWIGGLNFTALVQDPLFWKALWNTFKFLMVHVPLQVGLSLVLAALLNQPIRARGCFRAAFFLPVVLSGVVISIMWNQLYSSGTGWFHALAALLCLGRVGWVSDSPVAIPSIARMATWQKMGLCVISLLSGLQRLAKSGHEGASFYGAGEMAQFTKITIPLLNPILMSVIILSTINGFSLFIEPYVMTGGGPLNSTLSMNLYIYRQAFSFYKMGYAATLGFVLAAVIFVVVVLQRRFLEREVG